MASNRADSIQDLLPLISMLADGKFHSGAYLGERLQISRAAVWKKIRKLEEMGLSCYSVRGRGYRLEEPLQLLELERLQQIIDCELVDHNIDLDLRGRVHSTNDVALEAACRTIPSGYVCLAEQQCAGRGRMGRNWISPFARNIYMSMLWRFPAGASAIEGLSLVIGVAVVRALKKSSLHGVRLKWPNDVLLDDKKLAGILLEMRGESAGCCNVVIGVGLNVTMSQSAGADIDQPWTDISRHMSGVDRNLVAGNLVAEIYRSTKQFSEEGFSSHKPEWESYDGLVGKDVSVLVGDKKLLGKAAGIGDRGEFCLDVNGARHYFSGGEVSVRRQE